MRPGGTPPDSGPPNNRVGGKQGRRTLPSWMDGDNSRGQLTVLQLKAAEGHLPTNPFVLSKTIDEKVGKIEGATIEARGTAYTLKVRNQEQVDKLLNLKELFDGTKVNVTEHPTLNVVQCVVSCWEAVEMTEKDLEEELAPQGVVKVRRIRKKGPKGYENTPTTILTIQGTIIPKAVFFGMIVLCESDAVL